MSRVLPFQTSLNYISSGQCRSLYQTGNAPPPPPAGAADIQVSSLCFDINNITPAPSIPGQALQFNPDIELLTSGAFYGCLQTTTSGTGLDAGIQVNILSILNPTANSTILGDIGIVGSAVGISGGFSCRGNNVNDLALFSTPNLNVSSINGAPLTIQIGLEQYGSAAIPAGVSTVTIPFPTPYLLGDIPSVIVNGVSTIIYDIGAAAFTVIAEANTPFNWISIGDV